MQPIDNTQCASPGFKHKSTLGTVVGAYVGRWPAQDEQIGQSIDHVGRVQLSLHLDGQTFTAELVQYVQRSECFAVISPAMHEVVRPDMIAIFRPQPDA